MGKEGIWGLRLLGFKVQCSGLWGQDLGFRVALM